RSRVSGTSSLRGLVRKLSKFAIDEQSAALGHTLLTTSIDFFNGFCRREGEGAARGLLAALASAIQQIASDNTIAAYAGEGTFHIMLTGQKASAARAIAEQLAENFRATQADREASDRLSLTTAIVPWRVGDNPEQLLEQGQQTLAIARQSGGDCAIEHNAFAKELLSWQNELTTGSPFANLVAQDIMEPFPFVLKRDGANHAMLAALRRSGPPVWPLVDHEGRLVGIVPPELMTSATDDLEPNLEAGPVVTSPPTIAHNAAF